VLAALAGLALLLWWGRQQLLAPESKGSVDDGLTEYASETALEALRREHAAMASTIRQLTERVITIEDQLDVASRVAIEQESNASASNPRSESGGAPDESAIEQIVLRILTEEAFKDTLAEARTAANDFIAYAEVPDRAHEQLAQVLARMRAEVQQLQGKYGSQLMADKANQAAFEEDRRRLHTVFIQELVALYDENAALLIFNSWAGFQSLWCDRKELDQALGRN
jgi:hypothetical protein